jgi:hypothetical protein
LELANTESSGAFIKAEPNVDRLDVPTKIEAVQLGWSNQGMAFIIECEIIPSKGKRLSCPDTCIGCLRDHVITNPFFKSSLGVFGNSGACEKAQPCPVVYGVFDSEECIEVI